VISIESDGASPVRILPHARRISEVFKRIPFLPRSP
jgi:hypothetical protein